MKFIHLCFFLSPFSGLAQTPNDSLFQALERSLESDSLFETFAHRNRTLVFNRPEDAFGLYTEVERIALDRNLPHVAAEALDVQGIYFQNTGRFDSAEVRYSKSFQLRQSLEDPRLTARSYNNFGVLNRRRGTFDSAIYFYKKALVIAREVHDSVLIGDCLSNIALVYQNMQDHEHALAFNLDALAVREKTGDTAKIAASYNNLGMIYIDLKEYMRARGYLEQSLQMKLKLNDKRAAANSVVNIGITHYHMSDYADALVRFEEALGLYQELGDNQGSAAALDNLSYVAKKAGNLKAAYEYSAQALAIRAELGKASDIVMSLNSTGLILISLGRMSEALDTLDRAYALAKKTGDISGLKFTAQSKAELYEVQGKYKEAFEFYAQYATLKDSLLDENKLARIAELREKYETEKKEQELRLQEATLLQQEAIISRQSQQKNFITMLAVALLIIFLLTYFVYHSRLKARNLINERNLELQRLRSHFFANISHEFRTPLTIIQAATDDLMEKTQERKLVKSIRSNSGRLLSLVNQLLALARADAGRIELTVQDGDIGQTIAVITSAFSSLSEQRRITCETNISDPLFGYFDRDKLEKIVENLLSNAFKFTPPEGTVRISAQREGDWLSLTVSDSGAGIADENKEKIFDRFYQVSGDRHQGTGIGLALTKELVDVQGGNISVHSKQGEGTRFTVLLPVTREAFAKRGASFTATSPKYETPVIYPADPAEVRKPRSVWIRTHKPSVLVAEDNSELRHYIKNILSNYEVIEAGNGMEALEMAKKHVPDLIVSDVMMPLLDGDKLCAALKSAVETSHIPVILLTARASMDDKLGGLDVGADDYLTKPFHKEELQTRIRNLVVQRQKLIEKFSRSLNPRDIKLNSSDETFIRKIRDIIEKHLSDGTFTVTKLGHEIGLSRIQLFRKIHVLTNLSVSEFIRAIRLNHAAERLRNKTGSVSEVAYEVGFNDPSYFAKCFKARFGVSPGEYAESDG